MKFVYCKSSIKHDLQLLLRFSTLYPGSLWKIDTINACLLNLNTPPPWNKSPSLLSSTPSNVFEINKPPREHSLEELQNSSLILSSSFLGILRTIFMANTNLVYQLNWLEHHSIIAEVRVYIPASPIFFKLSFHSNIFKLYCLKNRQECVDYKRREFLNLITHDYKFFVCHDFKISDIDKLILALIFRFGVIIWSKTFFFMNY